MKSCRLFQTALTVAACMFLAGSYPTQAYEYSYARIVRLSLAQGDVQLSRPDQAGWEKAFANMPVEQGFTIGTNNGRAEIEFESGATARLAENTVLQFTELALSDGGRITKLTLTQGTATFYASLMRDDSFIVLTPQLRVSVPKHAEFRVDVLDQGSSVSVLQGSTSVESPVGTRDLPKGETLAYNPAHPDSVRTESNPAKDDWDRWVDSRENMVQTGTSTTLQYTNAPFSYGLADLSTSGRWNYFPGYGFGWQPFGIWSGWAPFWDGYWSFYPGLGWTWVSFEPWGWVPYHFGNWVYSPIYGWLWLPGAYNFWCPAPVQWVQVGNRLGWRPVPLQKPTGVPSSPARVPPQVPVVVSGSGKLDSGRPNRVLTADDSNGQIQLLPLPPRPNGKSVKLAESDSLAASIGHSTSNPASLATAAAFQGGSATIVPTGRGLTNMRSGVAFDPVGNRFVRSPGGAGLHDSSRVTVGKTTVPQPERVPMLAPATMNAPSVSISSPALRGTPSAPRMESHAAPQPHVQLARPAPPPAPTFSRPRSFPEPHAAPPPPPPPPHASRQGTRPH